MIPKKKITLLRFINNIIMMIVQMIEQAKSILTLELNNPPGNMNNKITLQTPIIPNSHSILCPLKSLFMLLTVLQPRSSEPVCHTQ